MVLDKTGSGKSDEKALLAMMLVSLCFVAILFMTPSDLSVDMLTGHASGLQAEREMSAKSIRIDERVISVADAEGKVDVLVTFDEEEKTQAAGAFKSSGQEKSLRDEMASRLGSDKVRHMMSSSDTVSLQLTHDELDELKSDYSIKSISYDHPIRPFLDDSIPLTSTDDAWSLDVPDVDMKGNSTAVCVVDTGVDYTHPAFGGCTHQEFLDGDCRVIDGYDVADDDDDPMDYNGHGTHVAGIVASDGDYVGMAPSVDIIAIKVFTDDDGGTEADIIAGIDRCVDMTENYDISAMTLSLGLETEDDPVLREDYCDVEFDELAASIDAAVDAGITVATATGNSGNHSMIGVPACVENAARVTSTTKTDVISDFSDRNALVNLTAPGEDIASTMPDSSYGIMSGTSMAAPHVAGLVSLLTQYLEFEGRSLHPKQLENALYRTGVFIDDTGASGENFSRIDALATLRYLDEKPPIASITTDQNDSFHYSEGITIDWSSEDVFGSASGNFTVNYPDGSELFFSDNTSGTETLSSDNLSQEGRYSAEMYALDNNSNLAYTNLTFNVTGLPLANITLLLNGSEGDMAINDSGVVNITAYHQDGELDLELFIDDSKEAIGDPNLSILKEFNTTDEHEIRVRHNETENVSYSEKISFLQVYNTTPQIIRWSPTQEDINLSRNKTMTFNQSSEDEQGLPLSFQWLLNDELMADDAWFELDGADPELGIHELLFIVNNTIRTNNISWQVNITPLPIGINISSPANTSYDTHEIPLEFSLGENPDIDRCWYELNESNMTFVEACDDTELQVPEDGHYTLIMYANNTLDENGSSEAGFTVDTIDPLLDLYGVPTGDVISQSQEFSVDASPGPSGLEGVFFDKGDGWVEVDQGVPFMPFSSLETTQDVSILFKAEDGAGNTNISKSKEYTVDLTPPEMDILTELPDKTNQTFNLTVALDEELAELSNFSYMINDRDWMFPDITLNGSRSNVTVSLNLSPGSNDVVLKSNDTLGNTGNITLDLEARGVLNISSQDTELESMLDGFEVSFEDEDG
ncbi:MAG: S8 family peptidase, partial [Candidatus Woesearchaeota archaeon]